MRGATVTLYEAFDGTVTLLYKRKPLQYSTCKRGGKVPAPVSEKSINYVVNDTLKKQNQRMNYKPKPDHP